MARPTYDQWLENQIASGKLYRGDNGIVWANPSSPALGPMGGAFDLISGGPVGRLWGYSTKELTEMYNQQVGPPAPGEAEAAQSAADAESRLNEFYKMLDETLMPGTPYHTALVAEARGIGASRAADAGVEGGLADSNTAYYGAQAAQMARERLLGLKGQGVGLNINLAQMHEGGRQFDAQMFQQAQLAQWQQQQQRNQMLGGLAGGVGGAIIGGMSGGPMGAVYGAQAGSGIVGGLAGGFATPPPPSYYGRRGNY